MWRSNDSFRRMKRPSSVRANQPPRPGPLPVWRREGDDSCFRTSPIMERLFRSHGGYWPRAYYGYGYAWFLPVLPIAYATYWYGGIPYYYANDVYYNWNQDYQGYTATDPPPVADPSGAAAGAAPATGASGTADPASQSGQIFMYPMNGQSAEQQSIDRRECQQWAAQQTGQGGAGGSDYQRAMMACIEGRGYSAN